MCEYITRFAAAEARGIASIEIKLDELGIAVPEERRAQLLAEVKIRGAAKRGIVTDDEFRQLAAGVGEGT